MICPKCNGNMSGGSPHCETIKIQMECDCGHIECEYYSREEMAINELATETVVPFRQLRGILERHGYNVRQARREIREKEYTDLCEKSGLNPQEFCGLMHGELLTDLTDELLDSLINSASAFAHSGQAERATAAEYLN